MSVDDSKLDVLKKLIEVQNRILNQEVRDHGLFAKVLLATGVILIIVGLVIVPYFSPLGWLIVLVGLLRAISSAYDVKRGDSLGRMMRLVKQEFGDVLPASA